MKKAVNSLKTTERSKLFLFGFLHAMLERCQATYFHLFRGWRIQLSSHSLTRLQAAILIRQTWQLKVGTYFFSVTCDRWVYTVINKFYWKLKDGFPYMTLFRYSHWYNIHLINSAQLCARPYPWTGGGTFHLSSLPHGVRPNFLWPSFPVLSP